MKPPARIAAALLATLALGLACNADDGDFYLKDGDRVVFYGDSITDQRLYTLYTEAYAVTRFPDRDITFVHSGWSGDRVTGGGGGPIDTRLERDVFPYRPTVVTVMLGMNDASYRPFDRGVFRTYRDGYRHLVDSLKEHLPDARLTLIRPSPFDDVTREPNFEGGYNAVLVRYGDFIEELGQEQGATVVDLNAPVVEALEKAEALDPDLAQKLIPDRVHPGGAGHLLMAAALLKGWDAPAVVTTVEIDASGPKVAEAERTKVEGLKGDGTLTWTQRDEALPLPIDPDEPTFELALNASDIEQTLDRQTLKVTGAPASSYTLTIDGREVGTFGRDELAEGVNLALRETPMLEQSRRVLDLIRRHNDIHFARWRAVQVPFEEEESAHLAKALEALDALEADVVARLRDEARPEPHSYELAPRD